MFTDVDTIRPTKDHDVKQFMTRGQFLRLSGASSIGILLAKYFGDLIPSEMTAIKRVFTTAKNVIIPRLGQEGNLVDVDFYTPSKEVLDELYLKYLSDQNEISLDYWEKYIAIGGLAPIINTFFYKELNIDSSKEPDIYNRFDALFSKVVDKLFFYCQKNQFDLPFNVLLASLYSTGRYNIRNVLDQLRDVTETVIQQGIAPVVDKAGVEDSIRKFILEHVASPDTQPHWEKVFTSPAAVTVGSIDHRPEDILYALCGYSPRQIINTYCKENSDSVDYYLLHIRPNRERLNKARQMLLTFTVNFTNSNVEQLRTVLSDNPEGFLNFIGIRENDADIYQLQRGKNYLYGTSSTDPETGRLLTKNEIYNRMVKLCRNPNTLELSELMTDQADNDKLWSYLKDKGILNESDSNSLDVLLSKIRKEEDVLRSSLIHLINHYQDTEYSITNSIIEIVAYFKMLNSQIVQQLPEHEQFAYRVFCILLNREQAKGPMINAYTKLFKPDVDLPFVRVGMIRDITEVMIALSGISKKDISCEPTQLFQLLNSERTTDEEIMNMGFDSHTIKIIRRLRGQGTTINIFSKLMLEYLDINS